MEIHPGGGQYDTVELHLGEQPDDTRGPAYLHVNRPGRVHVFGQGPREPRDLLHDFEHGMPIADAAQWVADTGTLQLATTTMAAGLGLMARSISTGVGLRDCRTWEWRSGMSDASDADGRRADLFRAVPAANEACIRAPGDLFGLPEYRFWFLLADGLPLLAVEPAAGRLYIDDKAFEVGDPDTGARWREAVAGEPAPFYGTQTQRALVTFEAFKPIAHHLASRIAPGLIAFSPGRPLTSKARWFCDRADQLLVVVVDAHEPVDVTDEVLAYALAWQRDRDLVLVLPETHVTLTLERLPWIDTPVRVFTYWDDLEPRPRVIPSRAKILAVARTRPLRSTYTHDLKCGDVLVERLLRDLDSHWALARAHRQAYLAWHCLGRQVVRIARTRNGVTIHAGVDYGSPPPGETSALVLTVDAELSPVQLAEVERRVADAVWKRLAGHDKGHLEHRMQAALASTGLPELGLQASQICREYPVWRGGWRPGFIDFLALDQTNMLHVIETKVGTADVKGVLQALDYVTWVTAHAAEIRAERGWAQASNSGLETVMVDFILAPKNSGPAVGPYLAGQLEALTGSVPWRIAIVADPLADVPGLIVLGARTIPPEGPLVATPVQEPRWAAMTDH